MKFETLNTGKFASRKRVFIGVTAVVLVLVAVGSFLSYAKYQSTQTIKLAEGVVNYKVPDLNMVAMYQENSSGTWTEINTVPASGYNLVTTGTGDKVSACYVNGTKDTSITISYSGGAISVSNLTKKGTKCYLYFSIIRDTEKPVVSKVEATSVTKTSIAVKVTATDNEGVTKYYYSINGGTYTEKTTNTHTFSGLTKGTTYTISVKARDAAGNESAVKTLSVATENDAASDTIIGGITPNPGSTSITGVETGNKGILTGTDNDGTTYYYRGAVTNNYLKFANKWWRIIRINGDGTIRIIYDGTAYHANGTSTSDSIAVTNTAFNSSANDNAYVGFKYGKTGQSTYAATHANTNKSTILTALETWYTNNLASYANRIDTNAGFCNDRSINTGSTSWWSSDTKKGYGTNATAYGPWSRILNSSGSWNNPQTPTFNCPNSNDLFTVSGASKGNKSLTYPIGLVTADEVIYAGGFGGSSNSSYYLYNGQYYWTMSPWALYTNGLAYVFYVNSTGNLGGWNVSNSNGVRPVINLRADVPITGSGTQNDPYVVS